MAHQHRRDPARRQISSGAGAHEHWPGLPPRWKSLGPPMARIVENFVVVDDDRVVDDDDPGPLDIEAP